MHSNLQVETLSRIKPTPFLIMEFNLLGMERTKRRDKIIGWFATLGPVFGERKATSAFYAKRMPPVE